ncbi:MAG: hypothetical protein JNJ54_04245 [Myxococcaceae bacterium]|nr:hypothetical protein [Myxococcaceae bacterium]
MLRPDSSLADVAQSSRARVALSWFAAILAGMAPAPVNRSPLGYWSLDASLALYFGDREEVFLSTAEPGMDLEAHARSALDAAEVRLSSGDRATSAALSVVLRLSRQAATTPALNLPDDVIIRLAAIRATVDVDSYLVEPDRVLPARLRLG